jgi:1,2-diacylglycerol 3-alpha-glucosyltransferase
MDYRELVVGLTASMRIAIASSGLGHVSRGVEAWADDLATALDERGEDVLLFKGAGKAERPFERVVSCWKRESTATLRLLRFLPKRLFWRMGLGCSYGVEQTTFGLRLLRSLRRERVDILHVQDPLVALIAQRARALGYLRTKTILAHGTEERPDLLRRVEHLQHLAPWHLEEAKAAGAWKPTWTAIPNFIDVGRFHPGRADDLRRELGIPADGLVVLTAAAIKRKHKRIDDLIGEFARLRAEQPDLPAYLVVAGGREEETDELVAEGKRLLGDRVRFLVRFPRARMPELYRAADLFVLASLFEMMPIALIEATASGLPCVVHDHPILTWMTGDGGTAADLSRPGSMVTALADHLSNPTKRQAMGEAGRRHCAANFSRDSVVDEIIRYYEQVHHALPSPLSVERAVCASA